MSTDELLPLMVLATVRSEPRHLSSTVAFVTLFGHAETMPPHLSFQLTTLHAIYELIDDCDDMLNALPAPGAASGGATMRPPPRTVAEALALHAATADSANAAAALDTDDCDADDSAGDATVAATPAPAAPAATAPDGPSTVTNDAATASSDTTAVADKPTRRSTLPLFVAAPNVIEIDDSASAGELPQLGEKRSSMSAATAHDKHGLGDFLSSLRRDETSSAASGRRR